MTALCLASALLAFALFGLSDDNHHHRRLGARASLARKRDFRRGGWIAIALCCALAFAANGPVYGAIFWLGALSFGAATVFLLLNFLPVRAQVTSSTVRKTEGQK